MSATRFTRLVLENRYLGIWTSGGRWHPTPVGFPSTTNILGDEWRVCYHSYLYGKRNVKSRLLGQARCGERLLIIDPCQPAFEVLDTLQHERVHALLWTARHRGMKLKIDGETEERLADLFGGELVRSGWRP